MGKRKQYPNLREKRPHPHKQCTVEGVNKHGEPATLPYLKKVVLEMPYPVVEELKAKAKEHGYSTMSDMLRHIILTHPLVNIACYEDLGLLEPQQIKRDMLRKFVPVPDDKRTVVKGGRARSKIGGRKLVK